MAEPTYHAVTQAGDKPVPDCASIVEVMLPRIALPPLCLLRNIIPAVVFGIKEGAASIQMIRRGRIYWKRGWARAASQAGTGSL